MRKKLQAAFVKMSEIDRKTASNKKRALTQDAKKKKKLVRKTH